MEENEEQKDQDQRERAKRRKEITILLSTIHYPIQSNQQTRKEKKTFGTEKNKPCLHLTRLVRSLAHRSIQDSEASGSWSLDSDMWVMGPGSPTDQLVGWFVPSGTYMEKTLRA